jgi:very-short-patch-repair endonuclease
MSASQSTYDKRNSKERQALLEARARHMRFNPTFSENILWQAIRGKRLGVWFHRQVVIGNHIVDFLCRAQRLVIEVDGDSYHALRTSADAARDRKLLRVGYGVLRFRASVVESHLAGVVARVREAVG